jgi:DNA-directed RNA polymerase specialized sigma24 family protein
MDNRSERFLLLFEPHHDALWRYVRSLTRSGHDAEDVFSETVLQALEGIHRLRDEQAFRTECTWSRLPLRKASAQYNG